MTPSLTPARERVAIFLRERFADAASRLQITELAGDASTRSYYRVTGFADGSRVVASYGVAFDADELPYLALSKLLVAWQLPVPTVFDCDGAAGLLLLEDLGDCTLQQRLRSATATERTTLYQQALEQIARMQHEADRGSQRAVCFDLAFDAEKLTGELEFFVEHFLRGLRRCNLAADEQAVLAQGLSVLCGEIASWPRVLCHRDYHSRNLMWREGRLFWIDFQDARMGPTTYDVASLLRDSYVDLDEDFVAARLEEYRRLVCAQEDAAAFQRRFELTCIQRNLKALGTFGYQSAVRGKTQYLEFVPRTLAHVRRNLRRHPSFCGVARVLARHLGDD